MVTVALVFGAYGRPCRWFWLVIAGGAAVLMAFAERLPGAKGFRIRLLPGPAAIADADTVKAAAALNASIESCIALAPAQYQWSYKRFTIRPDGAEAVRYD